VPASIWIRCLQLLPYFKERGVKCTVNDLNTDADICVFVRWQDERAFTLAKEQKAKGKRIIFDLCVNYFDSSIFEAGYGSTQKQLEECMNMIEVADAVTCASTFIAERASSFHSRVVYIPDSINKRHFRFQKPPKDFDKHPRAIWSGVSVKATDLNLVLPLFDKRKIPLVVVSDKKPVLDYSFRFIKWSYRTFPKAILEGEFCLSPRLVEDPYNKGHSFFKIGVFMTEGIPALASPVPSYSEVLYGGGRLCHNMEEWEDALDQILVDRNLLRQWSEETVNIMKPYETEQIVSKYMDLFNEICDS